MEAEIAKNALETQTDELKQTDVKNVVEFGTQTGDCLSTTRRKEEGFCRENVWRQ